MCWLKHEAINNRTDTWCAWFCAKNFSPKREAFVFTFSLVREEKKSLKHHTCWENTIIFPLFMTGPLKKLPSRILSAPLKLLSPLGLEKESSSLEANLFQTYKHLKIEDWNESVFKLLGNATNFHLWVLEKDTGNCAYSICGRRSYYLVILWNF